MCFFLCSFAAEVFIKCKQSAPGYFQLVGHHLLFVPIRCFIDHFNLGQKWSSVSVSISLHHVDIGYTPKETKVFLFCHLILRQAKIRLGNMPMSVTLLQVYIKSICNGIGFTRQMGGVFNSSSWGNCHMLWNFSEHERDQLLFGLIFQTKFF